MKLEYKIFIIIVQGILIIIRNNKSNLENKLIRFIKFNKNEKIIEFTGEKLLSIINYVIFIEKNKDKEIFYTVKKKPKISFISTVYNQLYYLSSFISSIQNQILLDYELIFIDDYSVDKSVEFIVKKIKADKRIKLIKNKKNMGALYSRYIGQKSAQANYLIFLDCDDIVLKDGIFKAYNHIVDFRLDIVQFLTVWQTKDSIYINTNIYRYKRIISQPILSYIFYYDIHKGNELNYALWDKLVKKEIVNKAFKFIGDIYLKKNIVIHNDLIILFSLFQIANTYQCINPIGYYYYRNNNNSAQNSWTDPNKRYKVINSILANVQFLYEKTNDTLLDKYFCIFKIRHYFESYKKLFLNLKNQSYYYYFKNIIDKTLNSKYLSNNEKLQLSFIKKLGLY